MINRAWVAHARALAESLREHEPEAQMSVLIVDEIEGFIDPAAEPFAVLRPADVGIDGFAAMSVRYNVAELCTALKPWAMRHVLAAGDQAVHLDTDIRVYAPFTGLAELLERHPLVLTPHLLRAIPDDGLLPSELSILLAGAYNTGIIAARPGAEADALLGWWCDRLRTGSRLDAARGLVFEQRWADLIPGLLKSIGIWRDPGVNFGYWRAATSRVKRDGERVLVDGQPLRSLHFTGFDPAQRERLSRYDTRVSLAHEPALRELCERFAEQLEACGHAQSSRWPYGFGAMVSGARLTAQLRGLWDRGHREGALTQTPFDAEGERAFLCWLAEPEQSADGEPLSRYLSALHEADPELCARFPEPNGPDHAAYLAWAQEQAERQPGEVIGLLHARAQSARTPGLHELAPGASLGAERGETVVCIPVYGALSLFTECLTSVLAHTPTDVRVLIADDASPDPAIHDFVVSLRDVLEHEVSYLRQPRNLGFPGNVNAGFSAAAPADVVVLNSDCVVAAGWLEGLRRAAYSDGLVASASALTNHGTILSVPERNRPQAGIPQDQSLAHAAGAVLAQSLRIYPHLPTAIGHCVYVRRHALDLVGDFDMAFSPGYGEEVDFSQRCVLHGLTHVAADDVFVLHHAGGSFAEDGERNPIQKEHDRVIEARYPYYERTVKEVASTSVGRLPRAIAAARRAIAGLTVTIDGRCLGPVVTGTQVHTLEIVKALHATGQIGLRVIVQPDLGDYAARALAELPGVGLVPHTDVHPHMDKTDVAHRPYQVSNANDLLILRCAGERQVITHQDLIAYRNPGYFPGYPQWERYQRLTRHALASADRVMFFSNHAAQDAIREDLIEPDRLRVVYIGVDHTEGPDAGQPLPPEGMRAEDKDTFLLCLGTDFRHKNRVFALRLLEALRKEQGWEGKLVLAGPHVATGSSAGEEAAYLATHPELAKSVLALPAVGEAEKNWLMSHCQALLYPTTYEGFGLMPFEAADHDRSCLFASQTALAEILPSELATLVPWDPSASAKRVNDLLSRPDAMAEHVRAVRRAGERFSWKSAAEQTIETYWAAAASPAREAAQLAEELARVEADRDEAERKYDELWQSLTADARTLVAPGGQLSPAEQHTLAAVVRRPLTRRLLLAPMRLAGRIGRLGRGPTAARPEPPGTPAETFALHFEWANVQHMDAQRSQNSEQLLREM